ncbi:hypothetical protein GALMADRAFT_249347 [Galerina marginata CBS 339.88]|uniref:RING-type domain-containing protein n=1 Tax=Galerina marginata (strain CBS 339.88) TaxID=685588 RepID=A0A067SWK4_GALM3|nr:hypothetical protein GALMADRAFT_249347 [Galerina marginata CBS 339.88]
MPATRSASIPPRSHPFPNPSPPNNQRDAGAISLSSSEDSPRAPLKAMRQNKAQPRSRPKKPFVPPTDDIIEISSDDEADASPVTSQHSVVADFRRQINKLREESVKHKRDFERASRELKESKEEIKHLQALCKPDNGKILLDVEQLSDHLDCEICTCRMWTPYILPDCGHSFCQSCLQDWFASIQAQFLATHPHNDPNQNTAHILQLTQVIALNPQLVHQRHVTDMIAQIMPPRPNYTCPTCREPVRSRPTEAFSMKAIVRTIATAAGESSPKKSAPGTRKGKASVPAPGPWDGFFPPKKT